MECQLVLEICQLLLDSEVVPSAIGIITPYKAQEKVIKRELQKRWHSMSVEVTATVSLHVDSKDLPFDYLQYKYCIL